MASPRLVIYEHVDLAAIHALIPWLARIPYMVFLHGTETWRPLAGHRRAALERATLRLANSASTVTEARRHNPWLPQVAVTHLGVAPGLPGAPADERKPLVLMVGRMSSVERYKGHDQVLEAWATIRAALPAAELVVVGEGDDQARLQRAAAELRGVRFAGWVSDDERALLYRSARLLLQPSLREGFGLAAVEAAAVGTPVLGLRGTVIEELFPVPGSIALASSQTARDIAAAAIPVLAEPAVAEWMGRAGQSRVAEWFLESHFIERVRAALAPWVS